MAHDGPSETPLRGSSTKASASRVETEEISTLLSVGNLRSRDEKVMQLTVVRNLTQILECSGTISAPNCQTSSARSSIPQMGSRSAWPIMCAPIDPYKDLTYRDRNGINTGTRIVTNPVLRSSQLRSFNDLLREEQDSFNRNLSYLILTEVFTTYHKVVVCITLECQGCDKSKHSYQYLITNEKNGESRSFR